MNKTAGEAITGCERKVWIVATGVLVLILFVVAANSCFGQDGRKSSNMQGAATSNPGVDRAGLLTVNHPAQPVANWKFIEVEGEHGPECDILNFDKQQQVTFIVRVDRRHVARGVVAFIVGNIGPPKWRMKHGDKVEIHTAEGKISGDPEIADESFFFWIPTENFFTWVASVPDGPGGFWITHNDTELGRFDIGNLFEASGDLFDCVGRNFAK